MRLNLFLFINLIKNYSFRTKFLLNYLLDRNQPDLRRSELKSCNDLIDEQSTLIYFFIKKVH
jgi:hypothetical protein